MDVYASGVRYSQGGEYLNLFISQWCLFLWSLPLYCLEATRPDAQEYQNYLLRHHGRLEFLRLPPAHILRSNHMHKIWHHLMPDSTVSLSQASEVSSRSSPAVRGAALLWLLKVGCLHKSATCPQGARSGRSQVGGMQHGCQLWHARYFSLILASGGALSCPPATCLQAWEITAGLLSKQCLLP